MLVFDIKVLPEAKEYAEKNEIKIFEAKIIYHLFDMFTKYVQEIREQRQKEKLKEAVFPCILKPVAFFNKKNPIIMGVDIEEGVLKKGTPICVYNKEKLSLGTVDSIESNHKPVMQARKETGSVAIRIKGDSTILADRHFTLEDKFVSAITRDSIDVLKEFFRDEVRKEDWLLVKKLKAFFDIY